MNKKVLYVLLVLLCLSFAQAIDFRIQETAIQNKISLGDEASYRVTIFNDEPNPHNFIVVNQDYPNWDVRTNPIENPIIIEVPANGNASVVLYYDPNEKYIGKAGSHFLNVIVKEESTGQSKALQPRIGIVDDVNRSEYTPSVVMKTTFPSQLSPKDSVTFTVTLSNLNKLDMKSAQLKIDSRTIYEEGTVDLGPKEEKTISFNIPLDPKTLPVDDQVTISLMYKGQNVFIPYAQNFKVVAYSSLADTSSVKKGFLKTTRTITLTNDGNVPFKGSFSLPTTFWKKLFSTTDPEAAAAKDTGVWKFSWQTELAPYASTSVVIVENYIWVLVIIIVAGLIALLVLLKRSPMVLHKHIVETESDEGGLHRVKVLINIKNRGTAKIEAITVIDKIPKLLHIDKATTLGSLHPTKTLHNAQHDTLLQWNIDMLNPGEERVINYQMKSNLHILGGITLPASVTTFKYSGQHKKTRSNIPMVKG